MKSKTYLAINVNDFHENQNTDKAETFTKIVFIGAESLEKAKEYIENMGNGKSWAIIPKDYFDKNMVYSEAH